MDPEMTRTTLTEIIKQMKKASAFEESLLRSKNYPLKVLHKNSKGCHKGNLEATKLQN